MQGLQWLVALHDRNLNGILADEMGLGKTVQVLALLAYLIETRNVCRPFLIAAPAAVVANWEKEVAAWLPQLKVITYRGPAATRITLFETVVSFVGNASSSSPLP